MAEHTRSDLDTFGINFRTRRNNARSKFSWLHSQGEQNSDEITPTHKRNYKIQDSENSIRNSSDVTSADSPRSRVASPVQSPIKSKPPPPVAPKPGKRPNKDDKVPEKAEKPLIPPKPTKPNTTTTTTDKLVDDVTNVHVKFRDKPTSIPRPATQPENDESSITTTDVHSDTDQESDTESDSNAELVKGESAKMAERKFNETYQGVHKSPVLSKRNQFSPIKTAAKSGNISDQDRSMSSEDEGKCSKPSPNKSDCDKRPSRERIDSLTLHRERLNKIFADDDLLYESDSLLSLDEETDKPAQNREQRNHKLSTCDELLESSSSTSISQQSDIESEKKPSMKSPGKLESSNKADPITTVLPKNSTLPREPNDSAEIYRERLGLPTSATFPQDGKFPGSSYVSAQKRRIDWRVQHPEEISAATEDNEAPKLNAPSETDNKSPVGDRTNIPSIGQNKAQVVPVKEAVSPSEKLNNLFPIPAEEQWSYSPNSSSSSSRKSNGDLQWSASEESLDTSVSSSCLDEPESPVVNTSPKQVEMSDKNLPAKITKDNEVGMPVREKRELKQDRPTYTAVDTPHTDVAVTCGSDGDDEDDDQLSKSEAMSKGKTLNETTAVALIYGKPIKQMETLTTCSEEKQSNKFGSTDQKVKKTSPSPKRMESPQQKPMASPQQKPMVSPQQKRTASPQQTIPSPKRMESPQKSPKHMASPQQIIPSPKHMASPPLQRLVKASSADGYFPSEINTPASKSNKQLPSNPTTDHSLPDDSKPEIAHTEHFSKGNSETETSNSNESQEEYHQGDKVDDKDSGVGTIPLKHTPKGLDKFSTYRKQQGYVRDRHRPRLISPTLQCRTSEAFRKESIERSGCKGDTLSSRSPEKESIKSTSELVRKFDFDAKQRRTKFRRSPEGNDDTDRKPEEIYRETFQGADLIDKNVCKEIFEGLNDLKKNDSLGRILPEFDEAKPTCILENVAHIFSRRACVPKEHEIIQVCRVEMAHESEPAANGDSPPTNEVGDGMNGEPDAQQNKKESPTDLDHVQKTTWKDLTPLVSACVGSVLLTVACMGIVWKLYMSDCECECECDKPNGVFDCLYRYLYKEIFGAE